MKIRFLGAVNGHVTGSCTHFHFQRTNVQFLVDCGLKQGEGPYGLTNGEPFAFEPSDIDFVILTHAHQDHCGLLPKLYQDGFTGEVICTSATAALARANLKDSLRHVDGLFSESDIAKIRFNVIEERQDFGLSRFIPIHDHIFAAFTRSAHILGACSIVIGWQESDQERRSLVMSGDLGNNTKLNPYQPLLAGRQNIFGYPDFIVVESTYGGRNREPEFSDSERRLQEISDALGDTASSGGVLLIPAFSLHRTQELLVDLFSVLRAAPTGSLGYGVDVIVDSRLACSMTNIYRKELGRRQRRNTSETLYRNRQLPDRLGVQGEDAVDEVLNDLFDTSHQLDNPLRVGEHTVSYQVGYALPKIGFEQNGRCIVLLTGGGMCEGGPVVEHLKSCLVGYDRSVTVLVTGYMATGSLGARLVDVLMNPASHSGEQVNKTLEVGDIKFPLEKLDARVRLVQGYYSGHADQSGLLEFIFSVAGTSPSISVKPVSVFINHGQHGSRQGLLAAIREHEVLDNEREVREVYLPENNAWFDLELGAWEVAEEVSGIERLLQALVAEQRKTNSLLKQLLVQQSKSPLQTTKRKAKG